MAGPASTPQAFSFAGLALRGNLLSLTGGAKRRIARQAYLKRRGEVLEDMELEARRLEVQLVFVGPTCAADFATFEATVAENFVAALVHPIAGEWQASCEGPQFDVNFSRALDEITCRAAFVETEVSDEVILADSADPSTAAQNATGTLAALRQKLADYAAGAASRVATLATGARAALATALSAVDDGTSLATDPVLAVQAAVASVYGSASAAYGRVAAVGTAYVAFSRAVEDYVASTSDLFSGEDPPASATASAATKLAVAESSAAALQSALVESSPTPAGAAGAYAAVDETLAACYALAEALAAARPPTVVWTTTEAADVVTLATARYGARLALRRASDILSLNRVPDPSRVPAGTRLVVPAV